MSNTRAPAPSPINVHRTYSSPTASPSSESGSRSFASEDYLLGAMTSPTSDRKVSGPKVKPTKVNAHSYCGRHSDEFLFGPHGFGDLWRHITKRD